MGHGGCYGSMATEANVHYLWLSVVPQSRALECERARAHRCGEHKKGIFFKSIACANSQEGLLGLLLHRVWTRTFECASNILWAQDLDWYVAVPQPLSLSDSIHLRVILTTLGWSIIFLLSTQLIGYGFAGLFRDILVRPPRLSVY